MPRFYFHVRTLVSFIRDQEGTQLPDLLAAKEEAEVSARQMVANAFRGGQPIDGRSIEVTSEDGGLVFTYSLREAIKLS